MGDSIDATSPKARKAILVVDDDADIRQTLEMTLQYEGFEVWTAKDGEEAWKRLEHERAQGRAPVRSPAHPVLRTPARNRPIPAVVLPPSP